MVLILLFPLLTGCEKTPNMTELLAYEKEQICFSLHITDKTEFHTQLIIEAERDTLTFSEGDLNGIQIKFEKDGKVNLHYEHYKIPLPSSSLLKAIQWKELFHLSEKNLLWKIQKETLGGIEVYCCRADDVTVYIDAATFLPLKITQGELVLDVIESKNLTPNEPRS